MCNHRLIPPSSLCTIPFDSPFSSFDYLESNYHQDSDAIHRLFSLARSQGAHTLVAEDIDPAGIILDENAEISSYYPDFHMKALKRVSFWSTKFADIQSAATNNADCVGYAILKQDEVASKDVDRWHVFEAVFKKYQHEHNCVPSPTQYLVTLGEKQYTLSGLLFAQQNGLNKKCAQVALRTLLSRVTQEDVPYSRINEIARQVSTPDFSPSNGLSARQIQKVLRQFKVPFGDYDYQDSTSKERRRYPYQKFVYSGIESGYGALVGFRLSGPAIDREIRHIIPFYGHTFNKDTWAPFADKSYFKIGDKLRYVPSEYWTSSFLGHDDNCGPNYCVPRLYINPKQVVYVVELLRPGVKYNGSQAEGISLRFLDSVLHQIDLSRNAWLARLAKYALENKIVLRAISLDRSTYINHLKSESDWQGNFEDPVMINVLEYVLPKMIWLVEISIPELFPANKRKLGDIVLNAGLKIASGVRDRSAFLFVRLPGGYLFDQSMPHQKPRFISYPSRLVSHLGLLNLC